MNIVIELTRKCNQSCAHCLKGEAENYDIPNDYITTLLEILKEREISYSVTFSGGEPTSNLDAIKYYLHECENLQLTHENFYIATNGSKLDAEFAILCLQLYALAEEKDMCQVELSNDDEHDYISQNEQAIMKGLKFYQVKHKKPFSYFYSESAVRQGRFVENGAEDTGRVEEIYQFNEDFSEWEDHTFYLNVKGKIVNGCNWSYATQDNNPEVVICDLKNFGKWLDQIKQEND